MAIKKWLKIIVSDKYLRYSKNVLIKLHWACLGLRDQCQETIKKVDMRKAFMQRSQDLPHSLPP